MSINNFQVISKLGEGAFSNVYKVKRISDGQEYAMKKVKMAALSEKEKQNALNEVRILASINNPYIVAYKEAFFEDNTMTLDIIMEYAAGGDVYNKIVQHQKAKTFFKEQDIWNYAIQMIVGLKTLHDMRILHRDLKSANTFLSKDGKEVKLGDLNVSKVAKANLVYTQTGTPYYASPEVWRDQPYDMKSDIWSLGCVIYEIAALKPPFRANDMQGLNRKIQKGQFEKLPPQYSSDLTSLISLCLQVSPAMRPNCDKLLANPLLIKHGKEILESLDFDEANELLGTIKLPRNIRAIGDQLPKANYAVEIKSEEFEKGSLKQAEEVVERLQSRRGQRPYSQHAALEKNVKPESGRPRGPSKPISYNEIPEDKQRAIKAIDNYEPSKMPQLNPIPSKKIFDPADMANKRRIQSGKDERSEIYGIRPQRQDLENVNPNVRNGVPSRQNVQQDRGLGNYQPVNLYQNPAPEDKYRRYGGPVDAVNNRAENIIKRYQADAAMAEKREPYRANGATPMNAGKGDAIDILERYNNVYGANQKPIYNRPQVGGNQRNDYNSENRAYLNNNVGNPVRVQQNQQQRGILRPSWWG